MENIYIIGMGLSERDLTADHLEIIQSADLLVGGQRHLAYFSHLKMNTHTITGRIEEVIDVIQDQEPDQRIVVLASGDPLLYGIGARLTKALDPDRITVLPNISTIAAAFARIKLPWDDARIISLHGRDRKYHLLEALKCGAPVAVLTDCKQTPGWLAEWLADQGVTGAQMVVFEQMGTGRERICRFNLLQAAQEQFNQPNMVILLQNSPGGAGKKLHLGMADDAYKHQRGLITKSEVRAVALAKLCLKPGLTLWDLGAGSGSVGIEASVLLGPGRIVAVEQKPERVATIRENAKHYGVYNHRTIQAELPEGMELLPPPDRVFIGGGGRNLTEIIQRSIERLASDGIILVNTVLLDNMTASVKVLETAGLESDVVQLQVNRSKSMPWSRRLEAHNPVWIVSGKKAGK